MSISGFTEKLKRSCEKRRVSLVEASFGRQTFSMGRAISGGLTVHISNDDPGFWGVADNVLSRLRESRLPWAIVLLHSSQDAGFVLDSADTESSINSGSWPQQDKGGIHWKINAPRALDAAYPFSSVEELLGIVRVLFGARVRS